MKKDIYSNFDFQEQLDRYYSDPAYKDLSKDQIWDKVCDDDSKKWNKTCRSFRDFFNTAEKWIVAGTVKRWNRKHACGFIFDSWDDFIRNILPDADTNIRFYDEDGHLKIDMCDHDGYSTFEIKALTDQGAGYFENWMHRNDSKSEHECYDTLMKSSHYTHLPMFCKVMAEQEGD